jgi:hypothetical protein
MSLESDNTFLQGIKNPYSTKQFIMEGKQCLHNLTIHSEKKKNPYFTKQSTTECKECL